MDSNVQVDVEDEEFTEDFLSQEDPSMLHFLLASGEEVSRVLGWESDCADGQNAREQNWLQVSSQQLRDDLMTLLIAGHETTAAVLTWTIHCLLDHPAIVAELQEEVDRVLGNRTPCMEDLKELRLATRVINEAMRLYPQPPVLIRRALQADTFAGYHVPEGSDIFISVWNLHRNPDHWDRPQEFDPHRFPLHQPVPNEVTHAFAYLPFGGGRRKCIGDQFAMFEAVVALAMVTRRFEFKRAKNAPPIGMTTGATIHTSEGLLVDVNLRNLSSPSIMQSSYQPNGSIEKRLQPPLKNVMQDVAYSSSPLDHGSTEDNTNRGEREIARSVIL